MLAGFWYDVNDLTAAAYLAGGDEAHDAVGLLRTRQAAQRLGDRSDLQRALEERENPRCLHARVRALQLERSAVRFAGPRAVAKRRQLPNPRKLRTRFVLFVNLPSYLRRGLSAEGVRPHGSGLDVDVSGPHDRKREIERYTAGARLRRRRRRQTHGNGRQHGAATELVTIEGTLFDDGVHHFGHCQHALRRFGTPKRITLARSQRRRVAESKEGEKRLNPGAVIRLAAREGSAVF